MTATLLQHPAVTDPAAAPDHFITRNGVDYAGTHLLIDLFGARHLSDEERMRAAFTRCVRECHATLLHMHVHVFTPYGGLSGVAVLAESHITVHTWPERDYAAFDVFMCGDSKPERSVEILKSMFEAREARVREHWRGAGA